MLALTACSRDTEPDPRPDPAQALCAAAFRDGTVVGAYDTTVGDVRGRRIGPGRQPAGTAWPQAPDEERAAWCYVDGAGPKRIVAGVAAAAPGEPVIFAQGELEPGPGGPRLP